MKLTANFMLSEFEKSDVANYHAIDNSVRDSVVISRITLLCKKVLQPFREYLRCPVIISSGYRCRKLNELVGGVETSQHIGGYAADIVPSYYGGWMCRDIAWLVCNCSFDQLIIYPTFMHVSYVGLSSNRHQLLFSDKVDIDYKTRIYRAITDAVLDMKRDS